MWPPAIVLSSLEFASCFFALKSFEPQHVTEFVWPRRCYFAFWGHTHTRTCDRSQTLQNNAHRSHVLVSSNLGYPLALATMAIKVWGFLAHCLASIPAEKIHLPSHLKNWRTYLMCTLFLGIWFHVGGRDLLSVNSTITSLDRRRLQRSLTSVSPRNTNCWMGWWKIGSWQMQIASRTFGTIRTTVFG